MLERGETSLKLDENIGNGSYALLDESPYLVDTVSVNAARELSAKMDKSPGEVFRLMLRLGYNQLRSLY